MAENRSHRQLTRKEFGKALAGVGAGAGLLLAGCEPQPSLDPNKQLLLNEIESLPGSPIKLLLVQKVLPFYAANPQPSHYPDLTIPTVDAQVTMAINPNPSQTSLAGRYTFRTTGYPPSAHYLADPYTTTLPCYFPDRTVMVNLGITTPSEGLTGFSHLIELTLPNPAVLKSQNSDFFSASKSFMLVKEACGHLVIDLWFQKVAELMQQLNFPTTALGQTKTGPKQPIEIFSQAVTTVFQQKGRIVAVTDLAAYLLAIQATQRSSYFPSISKAKFFDQVIPEALTVNLGRTPDIILQNSFVWALTSRKAPLLPHQGDLNQVVKNYLTPLASV